MTITPRSRGTCRVREVFSLSGGLMYCAGNAAEDCGIEICRLMPYAASLEFRTARQVFQSAFQGLMGYFDSNESFEESVAPLRDYRAALLETDDRGRNLLQIACEYTEMTHPRSELIYTLIEWMPDAVQTINTATSPQLLHDLWRRLEHRQAFAPCVQVLVQAIPEYAAILDDRGDTLLHVACSYRAPLHFIKCLLDLWRPAAAVGNRHQQTPLHLECRERGDGAVVRLLLSASPESIKQRSSYTRLPLHSAIKHSPGLVDVLLEMYPQAVMEEYFSVMDGDSWETHETCLHWTCARDYGVSIVQKVLNVRPQAALMPNLLRRLPIHIACEYDPDLVPLLVQAYPQTLTFTDKDGCTPLHIAVLRWRCDALATVQRLVGLKPAMAARPDKDGNSPLLYACDPTIINRNADALSVVYTLLRAVPLQLRLR